MSGYFQVAAAIMLAVILILALGREGKQTALLLALAVCAMAGAMTMVYLEPVVDYIHRLRSVAQLDGGMLGIILKAAGIGIIGELASLICTDSGNSALGKMLQILTAAVILRLSLPLFEQLLELLEGLLGNL